MGEPAAGNDWKNGLCSCFGNFTTCAVTYFVPCYIFGKTAEKNGDGSCVLCGLATMCPIANLYAMAKVRNSMREKQGIPGSCAMDLLTVWFCPLCTIVQEAREIEADVPGQPEGEIARS